jgi:hypothetical protein
MKRAVQDDPTSSEVRLCYDGGGYGSIHRRPAAGLPPTTTTPAAVPSLTRRPRYPRRARPTLGTAAQRSAIIPWASPRAAGMRRCLRSRHRRRQRNLQVELACPAVEFSAGYACSTVVGTVNGPSIWRCAIGITLFSSPWTNKSRRTINIVVANWYVSRIPRRGISGLSQSCRRRALG